MFRTAWPTSHHISQLQSLRNVSQRKTYVDWGYVVSSESGDDCLISRGFQSGDLMVPKLEGRLGNGRVAKAVLEYGREI